MSAVPDAPNQCPSPACRCTRCAGDLTRLVPEARYCPGCGLRLSDDRFTPPALRGSPPPPALSSCVLKGYANAMFRLGVRYEVRHNDDEAVRCYGKASRLGNGPAIARLGQIPLARVADTPS